MLPSRRSTSFRKRESIPGGTHVREDTDSIEKGARSVISLEMDGRTFNLPAVDRHAPLFDIKVEFIGLGEQHSLKRKPGRTCATSEVSAGNLFRTLRRQLVQGRVLPGHRPNQRGQKR